MEELNVNFMKMNVLPCLYSWCMVSCRSTTMCSHPVVHGSLVMAACSRRQMSPAYLSF